MRFPTRGGDRAAGSPESREPVGDPAPLGGIDDAAGTRNIELLRRARRGDARALDELVRALLPYVGRICGSIALDRGDDALQNSMVAIVRNLGALREPAALWGWVRRIAVREAVRAARSGRVVPVDGEVLEVAMPSAGEEGLAVEVHAVLEELTPEQRAVLVLRHLDGVGEAEMAELLGIAPGTVKSRLSRARAAFRARWLS